MFTNGLLFLSLFARAIGFFAFSPFFAFRPIPFLFRIGAAGAFALLAASPLAAKFSLLPSFDHPSLFSIHLLKEIAIGYLLGFLFSLLFEAGAFAGELIGVMSGFSAKELFSSYNMSEYPFMSRLFSLSLFTLFFSLDLHHLLLRILFESFLIFPASPPLFSFEFAQGMIETTTRLFHYALAYAAFPMTILFVTLLLFAVGSRFLPNFFWIIFPAQSLIGLVTLAAAIVFFIPILEKSFFEIAAITKKLLFSL